MQSTPINNASNPPYLIRQPNSHWGDTGVISARRYVEKADPNFLFDLDTPFKDGKMKCIKVYNESYHDVTFDAIDPVGLGAVRSSIEFDNETVHSNPSLYQTAMEVNIKCDLRK